MYDKIYITLNKLAGQLGLPEEYLKNLAEQNIIPSLKVKNRLRFNPEAVQQALDRIAEKGNGNES